MATQNPDYDPAAVESRWQTYWEQNRTFVAKDFDPRPKYFAMAMYPYPSGHGLHMGHSENYTATDVVSRYKRARGFNVLQPMGWDAFGLPTEQTAVQTGVHPREVTRRNVQTFTDQLNRHGFAIDWTREINTTDPGYVKWTQWIFLQLFKHGLAYVDERPVWWCEALGTVLANEEVIDGRSERGSHPVERRALRQWVLRITAYADKLLKRLDNVDWPEATKAKQRNWIGRSEGASIRFDLDGLDESLTVFTTRPDTLYGATYMVLAPEHPLVNKLTTDSQRAQVADYIRAAANKSDLERTDLAKDKTGVFTGSYAINPATGDRIPVWVADYVVMGYGTGAIMAVPAHDQRDFEFAKKFNLPIVQVIEAPEDHSLDKEAYAGDGRIINSGECNGLSVEEAKKKIVQSLEQQGRGSFSVNYKLRDWLFSRQRYWGEPFPIVWVSESDYAKAAGEVREFLPKEPVTYKQNGETLYAMPVPPSQLPLKLPETDNFQPAGNGESALARETDWVNIWYNLETGEGLPSSAERPSSGPWVSARRETNTMPQWAGSCWYHLRYIDPSNDDHLVDPQKNSYWGSPDYYLGGPEHAVLHLLYAPFWHLFLYDIGAITTPEPYPKLVHQGMILGGNGEKMSKSRGNVVNPDSIISEYGADALRLYLMFMGPLEDDKPWNDKGIEGVVRFLRRVWREVIDRDGGLNPKVKEDAVESRDLQRAVHETIRKVTEDYERGRYNTAISQMMICLNAIQKADQVSVASIKSFLQLLAPLAPHICEELWERLGGTGSIVDAGWPEYDEKLLQVDEVALGILINGKPRGEVLTSREASQDAVLRLAMENEKVKPHLEGKTIRKVIYVPGKILNIVAN